MKITLKFLICMSLSVLLLISTVACNSPVETSTGNDTTAGMTEETTEITEGHFETSEEIVTTEIKLPNEELYPLLNDAHDNTEFFRLYREQNAFFTTYTVFAIHEFESSLSPVKNKWKEISQNVYLEWDAYYGLLNATLSEDQYILCKIYFGEIFDAYKDVREQYTVKTGKITGYCPDNPDISLDEYVLIAESYRETLLQNNIEFLYDSNDNNSNNYLGHGLQCMLTKEQLLNFMLSAQSLKEGKRIFIAIGSIPNAL